MIDLDEIKAPNFNDINSDYLINMDKDIKIDIKIKAEKDFVKHIIIPKPNKRDIEWVSTIYSASSTKIREALITSVNNKNTWRVAYMCKVFQEKDNNLNWFNPNHVFNADGFTANSLLSKACHNSGIEEIALLLQLDNIKINWSAGTSEYNSALRAACYNKDENIVVDIFKMLCQFDLDNIASILDEAPTTTVREMLQTKLDTQEVLKQKLLPVPPADGISWEKMDKDSICKVTTNGANFRLRKLFNFLSSTISETNEYLKDGAVVYAVKSETQRMGHGSSNREIKQAQDKLKKLNANQSL